jgi:hypothetical protein
MKGYQFWWFAENSQSGCGYCLTDFPSHEVCVIWTALYIEVK